MAQPVMEAEAASTRGTNKFQGTPKKATTHVNQNEDLIFEKSSPGKKAYRMAELDVPAIDAAALLGDAGPDGSWRHAGALARSRSSGTSRGSRPGTTRSIWACIRWAPAR